jgi:hypothetical protein
MSYNGSGTFNINTAGQPVVTGTTITSTAFNLLTADLATGLTTALTKDGQSTPTANIPMGTFKITGLGAGTAATDAAQYGQLQAGATQIATVTGTDTFVGTLSPALGAYGTGNLFSFVAPNTNTGASTINLNSLGAKSITKLGSTALAAGDIVSGRIYLIEYDGTRFQLINPSASSVSSFSAGTTGFTPNTATTGAVTLAGTLATTNGGTGLTSFTANGVVYASSSSVLATGSALTFDGSKLEASNSTIRASNTGGYYTNLTATGLTNFATTMDFDSVSSYLFKISSSEQMRLTSTGLGIGTSSPSTPLTVSKTGIDAGLGIFNIARIRDGSSNKGVSIGYLAGSNTAVFTSETTGAASAFGWEVYSGSAWSQAMTLDGSGNLGLGVTPSAWISSTKAIDIGSIGNISADSATLRMVSNSYTNSGGTSVYKTTGTAFLYLQNQSLGHAWYTAPSGTAGNAITFTQAMTLDASSRLLIGQTSTYAGTPGGSNLQVTSTGTSPQAATFTTSAGSVYTATCMWNQASTGYLAYFLYGGSNGTNCGSISYNGTVTLYTTTSDVRLKENIVDAGSGIAKLANVKIRSFDWIDSKKNVAFGVVAQEMYEVVPECVSIGNDDENGTIINPWSVDTSALVPAMIKAIQEQQALIESLTTRLTALESKA